LICICFCWLQEHHWALGCLQGPCKRKYAYVCKVLANNPEPRTWNPGTRGPGDLGTWDPDLGTWGPGPGDPGPRMQTWGPRTGDLDPGIWTWDAGPGDPDPVHWAWVSTHLSLLGPGPRLIGPWLGLGPQPFCLLFVSGC